MAGEIEMLDLFPVVERILTNDSRITNDEIKKLQHTRLFVLLSFHVEMFHLFVIYALYIVCETARCIFFIYEIDIDIELTALSSVSLYEMDRIMKRA